MKKIFTLIAAAMISCAAMAEGTQSVKVTFNGTDNADWKVSSGGVITSVANGVANVNMAIQANNKYRADLQCQTSGAYTMNKTKDIVWAIKFMGDLPGTSNAKKFEINYMNAEGNGTWINHIDYPSGNIETADGGMIYYFNLGADGYNKLGDVQSGDVIINNIHFILADAVIANEADAHYTVDWVASFASVADLSANADMLDDATDTPVVVEPGAIYNENQQKNFTDLASAVSSAQPGDVIILNESQTLSSRLNVNKEVTIKAGNDGVSIKRASGYGNGIVILSSNGDCNLTIDGVTLDGDNVASSSTFIEAGNNGVVTLKNLTVKNNNNTTGSGETNTVAIISKGGGKLVLENVSFDDNTCSTAVLFNGNSISLKGNIVFSGNSCNDIYAERYVQAAAADIEWTEPIAIYVKNPEEGKIIVGGGAWSKGLEAFKVVNEGWYLTMAEGSTNGDILLTQTQPTGINSVETNATDAVTYNLAGQRVNASAKGIMIRNGKKFVNK